jgi:hypothetical protein
LLHKTCAWGGTFELEVEIALDSGRPTIDIPGQGDCVIAAIGRAIADLTRDDASQVDALKFLVHFVGDVHPAVSRGRKPRKTPTWFAFNDDRPLAFFAGIWTSWHGKRGTQSVDLRRLDRHPIRW